MKKLIFLLSLGLVAGLSSCQKSDFEESYADPSKISTTTVEKQYAGFLSSNRDYVLPAYWNYFVILRTTINHYTQAVGFANASNQYVPGFAGIDSYWGNYYNLLSQYRELQKVYNQLSVQDQDLRRIYMITATIYLYDFTQKLVDLHGDIPFSEAGMLSTNGGNYQISLPAYDNAASLYTKMLDDLKGFADELDAISISDGINAGFKNQDFINKGDLTKWKMYCNSLRIRMLARVSDVSEFQARVTSEAAAIMANPAKYPLVTSNTQNIQINVTDLNSPINSKGFRTGLEDWDGNIAGKVMIDHMKANNDPRLRAMFEPGVNAAGVYNGLNPMLTSSEQTDLIAGGTMSIYNRSTLSRNEYFPGVLITASEISFLAAEAFLKNSDLTAAKAAYEDGIKKSIEFYYSLRSLSNDNTAGALTPVTPAEITGYLSSPAVSWSNATTDDA
ncbi:MAG: SusD/RagB family nutrient-binding outer membrane lipoprotein, partial [Chitinophagaceae bacterium]|nr:SusD/RagB family nutrient-binding outer membrane lipoprotein [Chitinophagaceae bacterium]